MSIPRIPETRSLSNARAMLGNAPSFLLNAGKAGPVFKVQVGPVTLVGVSGPKYLKQILLQEAPNWIRGSTLDPIRPLLGNGLAASDPPHSLIQRRIMQPSFHRKHGGEWVPAMREVITERLQGLRSGEAFPMRHLMLTVTRDVIMRAMFTQSPGEDVRPIEAALAEVERYASRAVFPVRLPSWMNFRFNKAVAFLHQHLKRLIEQRRSDSSPPPDLLTQLLHARDPETDAPMSAVQLRDEVMNIFFAGHETTANMLTWAVHLLSQHPDVLRRVEEEIATVVGDRPPETEDIPKLTYLAMVVRETLRLYPPAWIFPRQAIKDQELAGETIPKGQMVLAAPYVTHRLPEFWTDPDRFDPSRFEGRESTDAANWKFTYLPFGAGPHVCIGNHFALLEATTVLTMLVQKGRFEVINPEQVRAKAGATLLVENDLPVRFTARGPGSSPRKTAPLRAGDTDLWVP